jgi:single-stranded-DNA-specific exonuclease
VIITDHHEVQEKLPDALAIVNPKRLDDHYPDKGLAGVGVAFKVMDALLRRLGNPIDIMDYLDLVTLGTVADIVPLRGENRIIVRKGMKHLSETRRIGLKKLMEISGIHIDQIMTQDIGFKIAPRLNAVGRLESAYAALKLLLCEDETEGLEIARYLSSQNEKRQLVENQIYQDAEAMLKADPELTDAPVLVLWKDDWHPGVIGIVSSRLSAKYYKPTLLMSLDYKEGVARGSARSIEQVNIMEIFANSGVPGMEYGGHPMAAGFTLPASELPNMRKRVFGAYKALYEEEVFTSKIYIDAELPVESINEELLASLEVLKPFGQCNHEPTFLIRNVSVDRMKTLGNHSQHIRLILKQKDFLLDSIGFNLSERLEDYRYIRPNLLKADCVGNLKVFWHFGVKHIQFSLKDIHFYLEPSVKEDDEGRRSVNKFSEGYSEVPINARKKNYETIKNDLQQRLYQKYPELEKIFISNRRYGVFANPKVQDALISLKCLNAAIRGSKILFVTPTNSFSFFRSQHIKRFDIAPAISDGKDAPPFPPGDCFFVTIPYLLQHFEGLKNEYSEFVFLDFEYLFHEKFGADETLSKLSVYLKRYAVPMTLIGSCLLPEKKEKLKQTFPLNGLLTEPYKNPRIRLVDRRGSGNAINYIQNLVKNGEFVCVLVQKPERTVGLTKEFGKMLSEYFHNGEVVFYNQQLKPFQKLKIEDLISENKVRLLISTPDFSSQLKLPPNANLCVLEPPESPLEIFVVSNALAFYKSSAIIHLLYESRFSNVIRDKKNVLENTIESVLKFVCSEELDTWDELKDILVSTNSLYRREEADYYRIFHKIGMLEDKKIVSRKCDELYRKLEELPDYVELKWDFTVSEIYRNAFYEYQPKKILELFDFPLLPLL